MSDQPTTQIPTARVPSEPTELAALIERANADGAVPDLWAQVVEDHGYTEALMVWEAAHREIHASRRARAEERLTPGDRSAEGLARAQLRFLQAAGLGGAPLLRGEVRGGAQAFRADLVLHVAEFDQAEAVAEAFGFGHETTALPQRGGERAVQLHRFSGTWQDYRVMIEVITEPPPEEEPAPPVEEPRAGVDPEKVVPKI